MELEQTTGGIRVRRWMIPAATALLVAGLAAVPSRGDAAPTAHDARPVTARPARTPSWQSYVDSPASRTVRPVKVYRALARGGSITGAPSAALRRDGRTVRLTSTGDRTTSPLLILDMGQETGGLAQVRVTSASTPRPQLHACFSESTRYLALDPQQNDGEAAYAPGCDTANINNGLPGIPYTYDSDSHTLPLAGATLPATLKDTQIRGGFRYLTLFLDGPGWVDIDAVSVHFTAAPAQRNLRAYPGHFLSSSDELNKIWYAGAYTTQLSTGASDTAKSWPYTQGETDHADSPVPHADPGKEVIYDGAKRDRIVWQGDLAVEAPVTYLSTGDKAAVENSLASLAAQQLPDGYVPAESLVGQHNLDEERTYGEYVLWFVNNMAQNWLYTADKPFLTKWWPNVERALAWLESVRQQDSQGLLGFGGVGSCGHYGYTDCGHETYLNALYVQVLREAAQLARVLHDSSAATYVSRADEVRADINAQLWDPTVGAYRMSREKPNTFPQDGNAEAVRSGVASPARARSAMKYLAAHNWTSTGALTVPASRGADLTSFYAPLASGFEVEARLAQDDPTQLSQQSGITLMSRFWGWMLRHGPGTTSFEHVLPDGTPNAAQFSSLAHGWGSGPTIALTQQVLGVTPTSGGYATWSLRPTPGSLAWSEGDVPTPHGTLAARWDNGPSGFAVHVTGPKATTGSVSVPTFGRPVRVTVDGRTVWNRNHGSAKLADGYVTVAGVTAGRHVVRAVPLGADVAAVSLSASPDSTTTTPGGSVSVAVTLTARARHTLRGTLSTTAPAGWVVRPARTTVSVRSDNRVVQRTVHVTVTIPTNAESAGKTVRFRFTGGATATAHIIVSTDRTLFDFEGGTDGWTAVQNVTSVSSVSSMANGPGTAFHGNGMLDADAASVAADAPKTVTVTPSSPLDLSTASGLALAVDTYGGAPGSPTGYSATVAVTAANGTSTSHTFAITSDSWNSLTLDISGFAARSSVSSLSVTMQAVGSSAIWQPHFQIDDVRAVR